MRILVTGGAGFIGSHLVDRMVADGHSVVVLDDFSTGRHEHVERHEAIEVIEGDVGDPEVVDRAAAGTDVIYHLAAVASVQASLADPSGTHRTNLSGTMNVLEAAGRHHVKRVVYSSSAAVYGDCAELPVSEKAQVNPLTPYAIDKLSGEYYLACLSDRYGFEGLSLRFFNIYGPRQDPSSPYSGVISVFAERVRAGRPVTIYGDGLQSRDFVYVADLIEVLARSLSTPLTGPKVLNVGSGRTTTLLDLAAALEQVSGRRLSRRHYEARYGDVRHSQADVTKLAKTLGYVPSTSLQSGLAQLLATSTTKEAKVP